MANHLNLGQSRASRLRPAQGNGRMRKKQGGWVFDSGKPLAADVVRKTIVRVRDERDRRSLGKFR